MRQRWARLLFLHWAVEPAAVQRTLPGGLTVDCLDGRAWIGLVPFFMRDVRPAGFPVVPGISNFLELNVRTYVHDARGRPGVWFYSLDCNQWLAVEAARRFFHLPYEHASIAATVTEETGEVDFRVRRWGTKARCRFRYPSVQHGHLAAPGTPEFFLLERYTLFAHDRRGDRLLAGRVAHAPYRFETTAAPVWDDAMVRRAGFDSGGRSPDHTCVADAVAVDIFPLEAVDRRS